MIAAPFPRPLGATGRVELTDAGRAALTEAAIREGAGAACVAVDRPTIAELAARTPMLGDLALRPSGDWMRVALFQELYSVEVTRLSLPNGREWLAACRGLAGREIHEYGGTRHEAIHELWATLVATIPFDRPPAAQGAA